MISIHSSSTATCPCGSGQSYQACCQRCHHDHRAATHAETLMRSRYSAFVLGLSDYLLQTWHPTTRLAALDLSLDTTEWLGLEILRCQAGRPKDQHGKVTFKAYYRLAQGVGCLHEISRFCFQEGLWFYVDGKIKPVKILSEEFMASARPSK